ncbi:MAG: Recombinase [Candidatus Nomurabacteria bacterium GW2011_GWF2_35_66]|uniref:Recombinase n=1 Tax=Candidatus Nomurabacteria bacterium GW2011_GWE1_35_16 TaxID=1618761 RepID=A0A0G0EEE8_9BACT|nr:MAG: Recombinase [Candidatus Nomurabacteria bacterium GW2011_GWF1_34_20]KKP62878.1 MAG: Recombinase [Candidatus Nomurabacteria bacterium GW2011_GWE2_34_25]KKP65707.1 MAG: Recombinase [Candidatus Nomurabacteria bacterium GW2011_GWE1_35_16]KKP82812.1 MAG: Recombinase [Candidatus Nomurabacteria bacterium GW2011_GWF2_35_66]
MSQKFFLYARKSTDVEDKQVLSIEAQLQELRDYAKIEKLDIAQEFIEKQSAKIPGRPIFNEIMKCIEKGDADSILSWHPDRLARNSIDGGKIIYLLDTGILASLKFPRFWCDSTSQGKFMLNMAFGQSKYYVDSLSENTKRGLRQKVRRGEYPGLSPIGYINDSRTKTIVIDTKSAPVIKKAFEMYAQGNQTLDTIGMFLAKNQLLTKHGKKIHRTRATFILSNPFYYGHFKYAGEVHEGKFEPIVDKKLWDRVQEVMKERSRPRLNSKNDPQVFCGLINCGTCGMMITGEYRVKKQISGKEHYYTYYHCSKKRRDMKCGESCIRQEILDEQISSLLSKVSMPQDWADYLNTRLEGDKMESAQSVSVFVEKNQKRIRDISTKLERLLEGYLDQDIEKEIYRIEKAKLLSEKKSLEEEISRNQQKQKHWLEPMQEWIKEAQNMKKIALDCNLLDKKVAAKKVFGSNLLLQNKIVRASAPDFSNSIANQTQTAWACLRHAHSLTPAKPICTVLVPRPRFELGTYPSSGERSTN